MHRLLLFLLLGFCAAACASSRHHGLQSDLSAGGSGNTKTGEPIRLLFRSYRGKGLELGLVNESHTDRLEHYSTTRDKESAAAGQKVASDEIVLATVTFMIDEGFDEYSQPGPAPMSSARTLQSLEVMTREGTRHMNLGRETGEKEKRVFLTCVQAFSEVYNNVYGAQSVSNAEGAGLFQHPTPRRGR